MLARLDNCDACYFQGVNSLMVYHNISNLMPHIDVYVYDVSTVARKKANILNATLYVHGTLRN